MNREELGKLYPIKVVEYDSKWRELFKNEKEILEEILGTDIALRIEHIGSTAVPNLAAKSTIDVLMEIPQSNDIQDLIISKMTDNEYIHMKEQKNHLMFVKGYTPEGLEEYSYHIHMARRDQDWLWDRLYFRDYLRINPSIAKEYEDLKFKLAEVHKYDREDYTDNKGEFIKRVTEIAKKELS